MLDRGALRASDLDQGGFASRSRLNSLLLNITIVKISRMTIFYGVTIRFNSHRELNQIGIRSAPPGQILSLLAPGAKPPGANRLRASGPGRLEELTNL